MSPFTDSTFTANGDMMIVGGIALDRLVERVGTTPFFAYDRDAITQRVATLKSKLPSDINLGYAIKANPMPALVQHLAGLVDAFDVASADEMRVALDTPMGPDRVSFAGPGKTAAELRQAVAAGITVELESQTEAQRVVDAGNLLGIRPRVAIRVNPDFAVKGSGMRMGGGPQQFGIDSECVPDIVRRLVLDDLDIAGFHIFAGSQNLRADILCQAQQQTVELALRLADQADLSIRYLNIGGGFGIPYQEKDRPLDVDPIAANLAVLLDEQIRPNLPDAKVHLELGRYLVGEAGIYVTRVVDRKESRGKTFLVVDGGMHHQLAASGNFGQVIRRNYPLTVANRMTQPVVGSATVVGCLCTPLDLLGDDVSLPHTEIGDLVVLFQAGAYGLTASPTAFLSHPTPPEVLI